MKYTLAVIDIALGAVNLAMYAAHPAFIHNLIVGAIAIAVGAAILAR